MSSPPMLPEIIIVELTPDASIRDAVLGDLEEEFHARCAAAGSAAAASWYWKAALSSAPPLALASLRRAGLASWAWSILGVLVGLAALMTLLLLVSNGWTYLTEATRAAADSVASLLVSIALGTACAAAAGWLAAGIGRRARLVSAVALGMLFLALNLAAVARGSSQEPLWYWVTFGVAVLVGSTVGGLIHPRSRIRR